MEVDARLPDAEPPLKRFKATDLPLSQQQRNDIDTILHAFKKKGEFDALRKKTYSVFEDSDAKTQFTSALIELAESELDRNHALLGKDRRQAAPLIEGVAERRDVYKQTEDDVDKVIAQWLNGAEEKLREIRRKEIGEAAAREEETRGGRTDEDYARESEARRLVWAKEREAEEEMQRQREVEEKEKLEEERRKKQEEEEEKERLRAIEREEERKKQEAWEKELEERKERKKRQDAQWERERLLKEEKEKKRREAEREKEIEAAALDELIRESKRAAARNSRPEESPTRELTSKASGRISQLDAIMRKEKEQSERERARAGRSGEASPNPDGEATELERRGPLSVSSPATVLGGQVLKSTSSKVWVADGQRRSRPTFSLPATKSVTPSKASDEAGPSPQYYKEHDRKASRIYSRYHEEYAPDDAYYQKEYMKDDHRKSYDTEALRRETAKEEPYYEEVQRSSSRQALAMDAERYGQEYSHRHTHARSRSPKDAHRSDPLRSNHRKTSQDREGDRPRRRSRSRDPKDIDRYVPSTSARSKESGSRRDYEPKRDYESKREYDSKREYTSKRDYDSRHDYTSKREYDTKRDYDTPRRVSRDDRTDRPDRYSREDKESRKPVEIDSYIPSTSIRARARRRDDDRDRDPEKERDRDPEDRRDRREGKNGGRESRRRSRSRSPRSERRTERVTSSSKEEKE